MNLPSKALPLRRSTCARGLVRPCAFLGLDLSFMLLSIASQDTLPLMRHSRPPSTRQISRCGFVALQERVIVSGTSEEHRIAPENKIARIRQTWLCK